MPIASLICGVLALLMALGGIFTAALPIVGSVLAFGSPVLALAGIVLGGIGHSRSEDMKGVAIAGLVVSILAFVFGLLVAMTCGMCNACVTAGAAGTAGAAQGMSSTLGNPNNWPAPPDPSAGHTPPPFPSTSADPRAPIDGETAPPLPVADVLEHLNRSCFDAWCAPTNRDYLFTDLSCNATECAIQFTAYHFDRDLPGPYQGRVRIPREAIQPSGGTGSLLPEPLDAALSMKLEGWAPAGSSLEDTTHPELRFVAWADMVCPDGWCEGEIAYDYEHVRCEGDDCTLYFRWGDYDMDTDTTRWIPAEMSLPRWVIVADPDDDASWEPAMQHFMDLTNEFTRAHSGA